MTTPRKPAKKAAAVTKRGERLVTERREANQLAADGLTKVPARAGWSELPGRCPTCHGINPLDTVGQIVHHYFEGNWCDGSGKSPDYMRDKFGEKPGPLGRLLEEAPPNFYEREQQDQITSIARQREQEADILRAGNLLVSDRVTKAELQRRLGVQADEIRRLRGDLSRAQGAVQSASLESNGLRAQNRELQRQVGLQAARLSGTSANSKDLITSLELTDRAERHLQTVLNLASFYMKHV
jgi:hypothetical protein